MFNLNLISAHFTFFRASDITFNWLWHCGLVMILPLLLGCCRNWTSQHFLLTRQHSKQANSQQDAAVAAAAVVGIHHYSASWTDWDHSEKHKQQQEADQQVIQPELSLCCTVGLRQCGCTRGFLFDPSTDRTGCPCNTFALLLQFGAIADSHLLKPLSSSQSCVLLFNLCMSHSWDVLVACFEACNAVGR
jgi:hypothetical protein